MLLFFCPPHRPVGEDPIRPWDQSGEILLWRDVHEALSNCTEELFYVVNSFSLEEASVPIAQDTSTTVRVPYVPMEAIMNADEALPVKPVEAAGGLVTRDTGSGTEVLLILRKGLWDLPKGKLDPGEPPDEGALREVREEIGVDDLSIVRDLGFTTHPYVEGDAYCVKTTRWYQMITSENQFTPQAEERIERVEWVPWEEAKRKVGYKMLRRYMERAEDRIFGEASATH